MFLLYPICVVTLFFFIYFRDSQCVCVFRSVSLLSFSDERTLRLSPRFRSAQRKVKVFYIFSRRVRVFSIFFPRMG